MFDQNFDPEGIVCCPRALKENDRLNKEFEEIKERKKCTFTNNFTISYLNVNRMLPHKEDISTDSWLMNSDIISFGETWLKPEQKVCFEDQGYKGIQVNTQNANGKGLASFIKKKHEAFWEKFASEKYSAILTKTKSVDVIQLYLSKDFDWNELHQILEKWIIQDKDVAIIGDTNINYLKKSHYFIEFLKSKNFTQLVEKSTHEDGGLLDQIYVNLSLQKKKPFYSQRCVYYSDHDEIVLHIPIDRSEGTIFI